MSLNQFSSLKLLNHQDTINKIIKGETVVPITCELDLSNYCNHSCIWCINGKFRKREKVLLQRDKALEIIQQLADAGVKSITLTGGGEPLTHPDFITILHFIREKGIEVGVVTNGGLLNEEMANSIMTCCKFVRISLDAGEEKTYEKVHRSKRNTLKDIFSWIKYFSSNNTNPDFTIGVAYIVHPFNYQEIYTGAYMVRENGADYYQIRPVYMRGMELKNKILNETRRQIYKCLDLRTETFRVYPILNRFEELDRLNRTFVECMGHNLVGVIGANGKMYVCCQLRGIERYCLGDLYRNTFEEIWNSDNRKEVISRIDVHKCPPCRYSGYNSILTYLKGNKLHTNFF